MHHIHRKHTHTHTHTKPRTTPHTIHHTPHTIRYTRNRSLSHNLAFDPGLEIGRGSWRPHHEDRRAPRAPDHRVRRDSKRKAVGLNAPAAGPCRRGGIYGGAHCKGSCWPALAASRHCKEELKGLLICFGRLFAGRLKTCHVPDLFRNLMCSADRSVTQDRMSRTTGRFQHPA
jgi:hypothetical protein